MSSFEVYKDKKGEFRFRFRAANGEPVFASEGYKSKGSAVKTIESIRKNAADAELKDLTVAAKAAPAKTAKKAPAKADTAAKAAAKPKPAAAAKSTATAKSTSAAKAKAPAKPKAAAAPKAKKAAASKAKAMN